MKDIQDISDRTPLIADLKPSGKYYMEDVLAIGGMPAILKYLWQKGFLHGECLTVTGKTMAENLAEAPDLNFETQKIIFPITQPLKPSGHLQILYGNLAPGGAVAKITGKEGERFEGIAKVCEREEDEHHRRQRALHFRTRADVECHRHEAQRGHQCGHQHRTQAAECTFDDRSA